MILKWCYLKIPSEYIKVQGHTGSELLFSDLILKKALQRISYFFLLICLFSTRIKLISEYVSIKQQTEESIPVLKDSKRI